MAYRESDRPIVSEKPGNAGGEKGPTKHRSEQRGTDADRS